MNFTETIIAWSPDTDRVAAGPWPDTTGWSDAYDFTDGACERALHEMTPEQQVTHLFALFNMIVRDGVPADAAHRAFLAIEEYRRRVIDSAHGT